MPKLFWKSKTEEVLHLSRPTTRSGSPGQHIFQLQDEGSKKSLDIVGNKVSRNSSISTPDLLRLETHSTNFSTKNSFESTLSELRAQVNGQSSNRESRSRRGSRLTASDFTQFQFPEDLQQPGRRRTDTEENRNLYISGTGLKQHFSKSNSPVIGVNGQEVDLEDDITKMAAQRDQQRGTTRFNRGMMAPVMSKDEESKNLNASKKTNLLKQQSDSGLDYSNHNSPDSTMREMSRNSFSESDSGAVLTKFSEKNSSRNLRDGGRRSQKNSEDDLMGDYNARDIISQSNRRQTMKERSSLFDPSLDANEISSRPRLSTGSIGINSPNDFTVIRSNTDREKESERRRSSFTEDTLPCSREDVQILNLHGFMDSGLIGHSVVKHDPKKQRRHLRRLIDDSPVDITRRGGNRQGREKLRRRRGRNGNLNVSTSEGGEDEVILKDIDDIDENLSSLVIGRRKPFKDAIGRPITFDEVQQLRLLLTGNISLPLSKEWLDQSFVPNPNSNISYGLLQKKGGPCGVLASVQSHMMKCLIFGSRLSPTISPASPLRPSPREWGWALSVAITEILLRICDNQKSILALPGSFSHFSDHGIGRYIPDGLSETITIYEFNTEASLLNAVESHLQVFTSSAGCVLLLYSCLLTRGLGKVATDMDAGGVHLINNFGYASQEVVNLMLTGKATTNTFDGDQTFGEDGPQQQEPQALSRDNSTEESDENISSNENKMVLKGIRNRSEIGLLSLFDHYGSCKVGCHLKSPNYPMWVICSESHYSVLFGRDQHIARNDYPSDPFDLYYYDGLALQDDEIRLTIDPRKNAVEAELIAPLEYCIRTKWPKAFISWNGTDPIL